eukprot:448394-Hanusia_phi.AAC.5
MGRTSLQKEIPMPTPSTSCLRSSLLRACRLLRFYQGKAIASKESEGVLKEYNPGDCFGLLSNSTGDRASQAYSLLPRPRFAPSFPVYAPLLCDRMSNVTAMQPQAQLELIKVKAELAAVR